MSDTPVKIAAARQAQSAADKQSLIERLRNKKRRQKELTVKLNGEDVTLIFQALSATELDKLRAKHPPTKDQIAQGLGVNMNTFQPALVAASLVDPKMSEDEARELWSSDYWSAGELAQLFETASAVCLEGMDIPSIASV